jgi:tetratricopeptide (TPR) repeat protein
MRASEKESFATLFARAVEHHLQGRVSEALSLYDTIVRNHPDAAGAHCNRGLALQSLNQPDAALQSYDRAITLDPRYADAHYNMAILLRNMNRLSEAVESYDRAIKYNPGACGGLEQQGQCPACARTIRRGFAEL